MTLPAVPVSPGVAYIDLNFQGRLSAIATAVISGPGQVALVDPGPSSCLETLESGLNGRGLRLADVTDLLLTHIHLDHAGAAGTLVRHNPRLRVYVHERGAPHLADPGKLLSSAARLYGAEMDRLWAEVAPVPAGNLTPLSGGEQIRAGGRTFEVAYTPGHASHHVSFFDRSSGLAFVGDTAGMSVNGGYVLPPTPPPDIDVELWEGSVGRIEAWSPAMLFLTLYGPVMNVRPHLLALLENLRNSAAVVKASLEGPGTDDERAEGFSEYLRRELRRSMTDTEIESYRVTAPPQLLWLGLARYWRKRGI
jgi:glyoxylase-like metal-dependent hydrolase (beta-lactamase superfamily II)